MLEFLEHYLFFLLLFRLSDCKQYEKKSKDISDL